MKSAIKAALSATARPLGYLARAMRANDPQASQQTLREERRLLIAEARLQVSLARTFERLQARVRAQTPDSPACRGFKVYSQADEDGILEEIFRRLDKLGTLSRTFIEFGCGDGRENNTHYLLLQGFRGCWCDASDTNIQYIEQALGGRSFKKLRVTRHFLDHTNVASYTQDSAGFLGEDSPDLLSIDVDGNDLEIARTALTVCRPKILCVEYNAKFPPPLSLSMDYDRQYIWSLDDYQGATLEAWCSALPDYLLVACSLSGVNAFFVRREYSHAFTEYSLHDLYCPPRHYLIFLSGSVHLRSLKWLRQVLRKS